MDNNQRGKPSPPSDPSGATGNIERRRTGKIVHDERGNARVEWVNARVEDARVTLSLEDTQSIRRPENGYDPYQKTAGASRRSQPAERPQRRDLRKLSEWIKQMRDVEARRQRGDDEE